MSTTELRETFKDNIISTMLKYRDGRHSQREKAPWNTLLASNIKKLDDIPASEFASRMNSLIKFNPDLQTNLNTLTTFLPEDVPNVVRYFCVYHVLDAVPSCKHCGKPLKIKNRFRMADAKATKAGFGHFCDVKCGSSYEGTIAKRKSTNVERRGVEVPAQSGEVRAKMGATNVERHGKPSFAQTEVAAVQRQERFGGNSPFSDPAVREKTKQTFEARYRTTNAMGVKEFADKAGDGRRKHAYRQLHDEARVGNVTPLFTEDEYKGVRDYENNFLPFRYEWQCNGCGTQFMDSLEVDSSSGHKMPRCPKCEPKQISVGERSILEAVADACNGKYTVQHADRELLKGSEVDILVPELKLAIEYNGVYWHSEKAGRKDSKYHQSKLERLADLGYRLLYVWEDELFKSDLQMIKHVQNACGGGEHVDAALCSVRASKDLADYLDNYHREGKLKGHFSAYGLFYGDDCVAVMQVVQRVSKKAGVAAKARVRYASLNGYNVSGGFAKLLEETKSRLKGDRVLDAELDPSFDDLAMYKDAGFELVDEKSMQNWLLIAPYKFNRRLDKSEVVERLKDIDPSFTVKTTVTDTRLASMDADRVWGVKRQVWQLEVKK